MVVAVEAALLVICRTGIGLIGSLWRYDMRSECITVSKSADDSVAFPDYSAAGLNRSDRGLFRRELR